MRFYTDYEDTEDTPYSYHARKQTVRSRPPRLPTEMVEALGSYDESVVQTFNPQVTFSRHEEAWTMAALKGFYDENLIADVVRSVKGGKEASVYCCRAHPATGVDLLAAKIYRPREFRSLKNDALYREGRVALGEDGKLMRGARERRAMAKKTGVGAELLITSWIEHEYQTLSLLHAAGADVPRPFAQAGNTILMGYVGEAQRAAPALQEVVLSTREVRPLFTRVMNNITTMLANHRVHADLSAYNILYWQGEITLIDFPQAVDPMLNPHAPALLLRDVERVCQYFARYGVHSDPAALASDLWSRYLAAAL